ncbi:MAG: DUF6516 family protein [Rhizobiaceae bacterium]
MKATLIQRVRRTISDTAFMEIVVWALPEPLVGSAHKFKYRLALIVNGQCVLRYDNERGKGDHRHVGDREEPIEFTTPEALFEAFETDVKRMLG